MKICESRQNELVLIYPSRLGDTAREGARSLGRLTISHFLKGCRVKQNRIFALSEKLFSTRVLMQQVAYVGRVCNIFSPWVPCREMWPDLMMVEDSQGKEIAAR